MVKKISSLQNSLISKKGCMTMVCERYDKKDRKGLLVSFGGVKKQDISVNEYADVSIE